MRRKTMEMPKTMKLNFLFSLFSSLFCLFVFGIFFWNGKRNTKKCFFVSCSGFGSVVAALLNIFSLEKKNDKIVIRCYVARRCVACIHLIKFLQNTNIHFSFLFSAAIHTVTFLFHNKKNIFFCFRRGNNNSSIDQMKFSNMWSINHI